MSYMNYIKHVKRYKDHTIFSYSVLFGKENIPPQLINYVVQRLMGIVIYVSINEILYQHYDKSSL